MTFKPLTTTIIIVVILLIAFFGFGKTTTVLVTEKISVPIDSIVLGVNYSVLDTTAQTTLSRGVTGYESAINSIKQIDGVSVFSSTGALYQTQDSSAHQYIRPFQIQITNYDSLQTIKNNLQTNPSFQIVSETFNASDDPVYEEDLYKQTITSANNKAWASIKGSGIMVGPATRVIELQSPSSDAAYIINEDSAQPQIEITKSLSVTYRYF